MQILLRSKIPVKYTSEFREIFEVTTRARARVCVCVCEREREREREVERDRRLKVIILLIILQGNNEFLVHFL